MAHPQQLQFVKSISMSLADDFRAEKIIEIGSYNVNGSVRQFFPNADYLGVDLVAGPGVDLICEGDKIPYADSTFNVAISCECFEHNPNWADTFRNMYRLTKDGGFILFTCATTGRAEHGTTRTSPKASPGTQALRWDYYKNLSEKDFREVFDIDKLFGQYFFLVNEVSCDLYFFGFKGQANPSLSNDVSHLRKICVQDQEDLKNLIKKRKQREKFIPKPLRKFVRPFFKEMASEDVRLRLIDNF